MPTALIVGASRGIGRALAETHLRRGWQVIATVREKSALADLQAEQQRRRAAAEQTSARPR